MFPLMIVLLGLEVTAFSSMNHFQERRRQDHRILFSTRRPSDLDQKDLREEADALLSRARRLREEIETNVKSDQQPDKEMDGSGKTQKTLSPWSVKSEEKGDGYRLYVDIGREDGTWMDRRWGASGRRIPFTIDMKFSKVLASDSTVDKMVKDNYMGQSSDVYTIITADAARLRGGFDKMKCMGGCYRIDSSKGKDTIRFYLEVDGTGQDQDYG